MPNNYLSVLNKHIIQVENKNVGLKVGGGGHKHTIAPPPPIKKVGAILCYFIDRCEIPPINISLINHNLVLADQQYKRPL